MFIFDEAFEIYVLPYASSSRVPEIPALYRNKSSLKRNDSGIGFIVLILEQLLRSGKDLQKIRLITRWYSSARLTNAYARIFEIYYTNDFGFLPLLI